MHKLLVKKLLFWCSFLGFLGYALGQKGINAPILDALVWVGSGVCIGAVIAVIFFLMDKNK